MPCLQEGRAAPGAGLTGMWWKGVAKGIGFTDRPGLSAGLPRSPGAPTTHGGVRRTLWGVEVCRADAAHAAVPRPVCRCAQDAKQHFSTADLRALFVFKENTNCDTHDLLKCKTCAPAGQSQPSDAQVSLTGQGLCPWRRGMRADRGGGKQRAAWAVVYGCFGMDSRHKGHGNMTEGV